MPETYQTNSNAVVSYKKQAGLGVPATGAGGTVLRTAGGTGLQMTKATTGSKEIRRDGMSTRGRHGSKKVAGSWDCELSLGSLDPIVEAVVRDTWEAADVVLDESDFTSITTEANAIVFASGDPRALGIAAGDIVRLADHASAANNGINIRAVLVDATKVHTAETLVVNAVPDTDVSLTRPKKLVQFAGGVLIERYWTVDEFDIDIGQSEVSTDFKWGTIKLSMAPDGILSVTVSGMGTGAFKPLDAGSSPQLTDPTESTSMVLSVVDATVRLGPPGTSVDAVALTSLDVTCDIQLSAPVTFGSGKQKTSPDVFAGPMTVAVNWSVLRKDLSYITALDDETPYELHILAVEETDEDDEGPQNFFSIYIGNYTLGQAQKSALSSQGGARSVNVQVPTALVGKDQRGAGFDACMIKFQRFSA